MLTSCWILVPLHSILAPSRSRTVCVGVWTREKRIYASVYLTPSSVINDVAVFDGPQHRHGPRTPIRTIYQSLNSRSNDPGTEPRFVSVSVDERLCHWYNFLHPDAFLVQHRLYALRQWTGQWLTLWLCLAWFSLSGLHRQHSCFTFRDVNISAFINLFVMHACMQISSLRQQQNKQHWTKNEFVR